MPDIVISPQFSQILENLENGRGHIFITGKAGTGKSTLLQHFRLHTKIPLVVLAPTGVAAINVGGETIHSFFRFAPNITKKEARSDAFFTEDRTLYKKLDMIIIDEISMVRSDLLDCVDTYLRIVRDDDRPFGGIRMVFFGDLYQLPPVVTSREYETFRTLYQSEWFFDSQVMRGIMESETESFTMVELETIYRQNDPDFISLLGSVRMNAIANEHIEKLNSRVNKNEENDTHPPITLTGRRDTAAQINQDQLAKLPGKKQFYDSKHVGAFPDGHLPTIDQLVFKVGARVMFVANDPEGRYVNGTLGVIKKLKADSVIVAIDEGKREEIEPHTWELTHTVLSKTKELEKEKLGEFTQLPLMLAWAVTIHKSQGKTFDKVVINLEHGAFAHGQVYVALSRCRTFEGITLTHPVTAKDIKLNWRITQFLTSYTIRVSDGEQSREEKYQRVADAIEMGTTIQLTYLKSLGEESTQTVTPKSLQEMSHQGKHFLGLSAVSESGKLLTFNAEKIMKVE
ncbi:MAG: AAA family ATPase [Candidatus Woesebacteria bacterium]